MKTKVVREKPKTLYVCSVCGYESENKTIVKKCEKSKPTHWSRNPRDRIIGSLFLTYGREEHKLILCKITGESYLTPPGYEKKPFVPWSPCEHQIYPVAISLETGREITFGEMTGTHFVDKDTIMKWNDLVEGFE